MLTAAFLCLPHSYRLGKNDHVPTAACLSSLYTMYIPLPDAISPLYSLPTSLFDDAERLFTTKIFNLVVCEGPEDRLFLTALHCDARLHTLKLAYPVNP